MRQGAPLFYLRSLIKGKVEKQLRLRLFSFASIVLMFAYLLPNHYVPWLSFHQEFLAGVAFSPLVLWALWRAEKPPVFAIGILFLALIPIAHAIFGKLNFSGDGWTAGLYLLGFALTIWAGDGAISESSEKAKDIKELMPIFFALAIAGLISVGISIHQWLDLRVLGLFVVDMPVGGRPYANLAQPNQLATLLLLGLMGFAFLYEGLVIRGGIALSGSCLLVFGLVMTQSRVVLLAMCLIWGAYMLMKKRAGIRLPLIALTSLTALFISLVWTWSGINKLLLLPDPHSLGERLGQDLRITLWMSMLDAISRSPWFGYGWNQVSLAQQAVVLDHPATHWYFNSAHNILLDIALWAGAPVALAVATGLFVWFKRRISACHDPLSFCVLLAIVLVLCHAMVEYPLSYAYFLLPVGFMMGALNQMVLPKSGVWNRLIFPRRLRVCLGLIALSTLAMTAIEYFPLEQDWRDIRFEQAQIGNGKIGATPETHLLTQLSEDARFARTEPTRNMTPEQLEWMRKVSERFAWAASSFKYAEALALNGKPESASIVLEKMCRIQSISVCERASKEWKSLALEKYPEFRAVVLPAEAAI